MKFSEKSLHEKLLLNESWRKKYQNSEDVESGFEGDKSDETLETVWTSATCETESRPPSPLGPPSSEEVASTRQVLCLAVVLTSILVLIVLLGSNLL